MADSELLELSLVTDLADADNFYLVQNGNSRRTTFAVLKSKLGDGGGGALWNAVVATPADLVIYEGQNNGYRVLVQNAGANRSAIYVKQAGGWAAPVYVTGPAGAAGDAVMLRVSNGYLQWKPLSAPESAWANLIATSELKGDKGDNGDQVELRKSATHIQWKVGDGDWLDLVPLADIKGEPGAKVQLQKSETHIQWRYEGDGLWNDLVPLVEITGPPSKTEYVVYVIQPVGTAIHEGQYLATASSIATGTLDKMTLKVPSGTGDVHVQLVINGMALPDIYTVSGTSQVIVDSLSIIIEEGDTVSFAVLEATASQLWAQITGLLS